MQRTQTHHFVPSFLTFSAITKTQLQATTTTTSQDLIKPNPKHPKIHTQIKTLQLTRNQNNKVQNMNAMASLFLFFYLLTFLCIARALDRAPHGLAHERPMAFSPSAFEFFHPNTQQPGTENPCANSNCAPLPLAAQVEATRAYESRFSTSRTSQSRFGAGGIAAIVFGFVCAVFSAMGVYYIVSTRRTNMSRTNTVRPDA